MYYVYVLKSKKDGDLYIGSTNDLKRRLSDHTIGKVESTAPRRPLELKYYEAYYSEIDARNREMQLKRRGQARVHLMSRISESLQSDS